MRRLTLPVLLIATAEVFSDFCDPELREVATTVNGLIASKPSAMNKPNGIAIILPLFDK